VTLWKTLRGSQTANGDVTDAKPVKPALSRRLFLKRGAGAVGAAAMAGTVTDTPATAHAASAYQSASSQDVARFTLDAAGRRALEASHAVDYTDAEWTQILDGYEDRLARIKQRRQAAPMTNMDAPALTFDPRLPGQPYLRQSNRVAPVGIVGDMPQSSEGIAFASVLEQGMWIRSGQLTSMQLTQIYLDRIAAYAPVLENFVTVTADLARKQAAEADAELSGGNDRGPLHGIPYGLKDLADTAGIRTSWGAEPYAGRVPDQNAHIVNRLEAAGAVLLGKTTLGALAYGDRWFGGLTRNPWAPAEGSSGSSAGSASATAAGLCSFAIGTETLGSIVSPSARCGTVGLRPSFGRVGRSGAMALCWSLDKFGPICRRVEDTALVLAAINGYDSHDLSSLQWGFAYDGTIADQGVTIGYDPDWFAAGPGGATDSDRRILDLLRAEGYTLRAITVPDRPYRALLTQLEAEAAAAFEDLTLTDQDDLLAWQDDRAWPNTFRSARLTSMVELVQADRLRRQVMEDMARLYREVDIIACPSFSGDMLTITNFTGSPCLTIPVGFEDRPLRPRTGEVGATEGPVTPMPHSFTLWGNLFREDQLIGVGRKLEAALNFRLNRPRLEDL